MDILANLCLMNTIGAGRVLTDKTALQNFEHDVNMERDRLFFMPEVVFFRQE